MSCSFQPFSHEKPISLRVNHHHLGLNEAPAAQLHRVKLQRHLGRKHRIAMFSRIAFHDGERNGYILAHKRMEYHGISYSMSFCSSKAIYSICNIGISWNILGVIASGICEHYVTQQDFWRISGKNHGDEWWIIGYPLRTADLRSLEVPWICNGINLMGIFLSGWRIMTLFIQMVMIPIGIFALKNAGVFNMTTWGWDWIPLMWVFCLAWANLTIWMVGWTSTNRYFDARVRNIPTFGLYMEIFHHQQCWL